MQASSAARKTAEIKHFSNTERFGERPSINNWWVPRYLSPRIKEVFGTEGHIAFFAEPIRRAALEHATVSVVSIGSGDGSAECSIVARLRQQGVENFRITAFEQAPALVKSAAAKASEAGISQWVEFIEGDNIGDRQAHIVICKQVLHHIEDLEGTFDAISKALVPGGSILVRDMIGRNGHKAWPEALDIINGIWAAMPDRHKLRNGQTHESFPDIDFSLKTNEGIRAQDILPLLVERFSFRGFYAYGGLVERFLGKGFGGNFDPKREDDRGFVNMLQMIEDLAIDGGAMKPTQIVAEMTNTPSECRQWRGRSPGFCLRHG